MLLRHLQVRFRSRARKKRRVRPLWGLLQSLSYPRRGSLPCWHVTPACSSHWNQRAPDPPRWNVEASRPCLYPAFRRLRRDVLSYKWSQEQRINISEVTAFLVELRRRTRTPLSMESGSSTSWIPLLPSNYVLSKGRSSSGRLNRLCRRVTVLDIAAAVIPISFWTISKWNFSDGASRKYGRA